MKCTSGRFGSDDRKWPHTHSLRVTSDTFMAELTNLWPLAYFWSISVSSLFDSEFWLIAWIKWKEDRTVPIKGVTDTGLAARAATGRLTTKKTSAYQSCRPLSHFNCDEFWGFFLVVWTGEIKYYKKSEPLRRFNTYHNHNHMNFWWKVSEHSAVHFLSYIPSSKTGI